ncbi:dipeptide/oligopeptide/nickel ABC transporter permease/ATP-binding protein [Microbacterium marinilacus]|uniref:Dipeptide/oligopeptide/nickel ABC transporter permease/ATP-binding protein n=1 Tax=Microbacterium marinilacus TaxID=415209 RepID=A0ABP7BH67_9MICO|nr:dipeptide/oligopeptide/nickel ABC transporter permease/ATP-binding protein [Microbacterium marinilacus]MBY0689569.1 dipeptide/oligopeptide/nickel ABC transporter permease/ATP-binding protein [Microbacterium marinilacus]
MRALRILRSPLGLGAALMLVVVLAVAIVAPLLWGQAAELRDTTNINAAPSLDHPIGTDALGRDLLLRTLVATRLTVVLALGATAIALVIGVVLGAAPLLLGRALGRIVVTGVNIAVAFPGILLALFLATILGVGEYAAMWAIGVAGAPAFARLCQTLVAGVMDRDYIGAARVAGRGRFHILLRHVLPNIAEPLIVNATIAAGGALLAFAGLSFLGLGVQAPAYDWGRLMMEGLSRIYLNPLAALAPGVAVVVAGLAFNLTGEALAKVYSVSAMPVTILGMRARRARVSGPAAASGGEADGVVDDAVLDVRGLRVTLPGPRGDVAPVRGVDLRIAAREAVGIVGESGSGKSLTALAIAQLVEAPLRVEAETLRFAGDDLAVAPRGPSAVAARRRLLGTSLAMVFQDPMTSFNPTMRMGVQLAEVSRFHGGLPWKQALARAVERLGAVSIPDPRRRARQYPHEFSGGMRQRAMIAMGIMAEPRLVIADEPTTALDVTVQKHVLGLLGRVRRENGAAILLISHDVAVVREVCDRIVVMYAGRIVEEIASHRLAEDAQHPYTRALIAAVPDMATPLDRPLETIPGRPVDPARVPEGCAFAARCPFATERCIVEDPALQEVEPAESDRPGAPQRVACWNPVTTPAARRRAEAPATTSALSVVEAER